MVLIIDGEHHLLGKDTMRTLIELNYGDESNSEAVDAPEGFLKEYGVNNAELLRVLQAIKSVFLQRGACGLAVSGPGLGLWIEHGEAHISDEEAEENARCW
jgi:hypothetical protein